MIEHTVTFSLIHDFKSAPERRFLADAEQLAAIPGVLNFEIRRQTNPKNPHTWCISMRFDSHALYEAYSHHPAHQSFIENRWLTEVSDFQEADFEARSL